MSLELATHPIKLEQNQKQLACWSTLEKFHKLDLNPELKLYKKVLQINLSAVGLWNTAWRDVLANWLIVVWKVFAKHRNEEYSWVKASVKNLLSGS